MPTEFELTTDKGSEITFDKMKGTIDKVSADTVDDIPANISESIGYETFNVLKEHYPATAETIEDHYEALYDVAKNMERERGELKAKLEAYKEIIRIMAGHE